MQPRLNKKTGFTLFILFFLSMVASRLFAAEYSQTYRFERPEIITLADGRHLLDLAGTRQKDDIIGAPILPVKTAKFFIPAEEKVVSVDIVYGTSINIEGAYAIQHVTTPHPLSFEGEGDNKGGWSG